MFLTKLIPVAAVALALAGCGSSSSSQPSQAKATGWTSAQNAIFLKSCRGPKGINRLFQGTKNSMSRHQINHYCTDQLKLANKYNPHHKGVAENGYVGAYSAG
jgi:hypothetical protein